MVDYRISLAPWLLAAVCAAAPSLAGEPLLEARANAPAPAPANFTDNAVILTAPRDALDPQSPAAFYPGGLMGVQIGGSWADGKRSPGLSELLCRSRRGKRLTFDEVCFFKTRRTLAGADIREGFIARKGNRLVLIGTGIAIKDPDDPRAEAVMREFQARVHAKFQQTGDNVLFANLPQRLLSAADFAGLSRRTPVLLVGLEPEGKEMAVLYGYLAPVNEFSALNSE